MRIVDYSSTMALALLGMMTFSSPALSVETYVGSWNALHLGWDNGKDYNAAAQVAASFDLVALQEVMSVDGLAKLEAQVEALTGESWSTMASEAIGRGSYREHYAFLWRDAQVSWVDGAVVYLDDRDAFSREPFSARFKTVDGYQLVLASVHLIYGETVEGREFEAQALADYKAWLEDNFPGTPVFIAGDFNLPPDNDAWAALGVNSAPLITEGATTLSKRDGRFANLYDNIWAPAGTPLPLTGFGIHDFPSALEISHQQARDSISDHAPVFMIIDPESEGVALQPHHVGPVAHAGFTKVNEAAGSGGTIRGNSNSMIYHRPDCPSYTKISARNLKTFITEKDALDSGFRIAGNCP